MAVLDILTAPHPVLSARARDVREDEFGPALAQLASYMAETMYAAPGVGLAAPQVGDGRRMVVIDSGSGEDRGKRLMKMVNPKITERSREKIFWEETCLSVPDFEVEMERAKRVHVTWRTPDGAEHAEWFEEYEAVIVQHELDHLKGTVLLDAVSRFRRQRYLTRRKRAALRSEALAR